MQLSSSPSMDDNTLAESVVADDKSSQLTRSTTANDTLLFLPLSPEDTFDVYDIELQLSPQDGKAELHARFRNPSSSGSSSGRPTFKATKKPRQHFLGKKHLSMTIQRNEGWDVNNARPVPPSAAGKQAGKGYCPIYECEDEPSRPTLSLGVTSHAVLSGTLKGGKLAMSPLCGNFDPQARGVRDCTAYHFFSLDLVDEGWKTKKYAGGGYFMFDAHSQGRSDLLATLYCTKYEQRPFVKQGDIVVAELRLELPPGAKPTSAWKRFFQTHHASLHISKHGLDRCFAGPNVQLSVPNSTAGKRYFFTQGQAHEIVIAVLSTSAMCLEHEGMEKKWAWIGSREVVEHNAERRMRAGQYVMPRHPSFYSVTSQGSTSTSGGLLSPSLHAPSIFDAEAQAETEMFVRGYVPKSDKPPAPQQRKFDPEVAPFLYQDIEPSSVVNPEDVVVVDATQSVRKISVSEY